MNLRTVLAGLACATLFTATLTAGDVDLEKVTCVVNAKGPAKASNFVEYKDAKVFFCCQNCPKAFKKNTEKFATRANHQLVATEQYVQKACPISGRALNPEMTVEVAGVEVEFCCGNCKGKVAGMKTKEAAETCFGDDAFKKAFKMAEKDSE